MQRTNVALRSGLILMALLLIASSILITPDPVSAFPAPPALSYPWNGMNVGGTVIPFQWNSVYGAYEYFLQIATDPGFADIIYGSWMGGILQASVRKFNTYHF